MRLLRTVTGLPASLLLLVAVQIEAQQQQQQLLPTAVRKMGLDVGEKFFPEYYAFGSNSDNHNDYADKERNKKHVPAAAAVAARAELDWADAQVLAANSSAVLTYRPPYAAHQSEPYWEKSGNGGDGDSSGWELFRRAAEALARLQRRQWACPGGTTSCADIGYPYSCCQNGETCYKIQDTGLGPVGCCPSDTTCGGTISDCASGATACPSDLGGGCCIPGYVCQGVGCVPSSGSSSSSSPTSTPPPVTFTTTSTTILTSPTPSTVVVTVVVTQTPSAGVTTSTTTETTTPPSGSSTAPSASTPPTSGTTTTTGGGVAPLKPTLTDSLLPPGYCPTGYYACYASAGGGCCQTGRDCQTTSCPPPPASTTVVSGGETVVVPVPSNAVANPPSTCAGGWFLCPASAGPVAGCCPSGYTCGTASCTLVSASSTGEVQKELPGSGASGLRRHQVAVWAVPAFVAGWAYLS